jgi:hypothetical protein
MMLILILALVGAPLLDFNTPLRGLQLNTLDVLATTGHLPLDAPFWARSEARFESDPRTFAAYHPVTAALLQREADIASGTLTTSSPLLAPHSFPWVDRAIAANASHPRRFARYHPFLAALLNTQPPEVSPVTITMPPSTVTTPPTVSPETTPPLTPTPPTVTPPIMPILVAGPTSLVEAATALGLLFLGLSWRNFHGTI